MDSQDMHRLWVQLRRIADALERAHPPRQEPDGDDGPKQPRRGVVLA